MFNYNRILSAIKNLLGLSNGGELLKSLDRELEVELAFATNGEGLSETSEDEFDSFAICLLQWMSQKPWIIINLAKEEFQNYSTEWDLVTSSNQALKSGWQLFLDLHQLKVQEPKNFESLITLLCHKNGSIAADKLTIFSLNEDKWAKGEVCLVVEKEIELQVVENNNKDATVRILETPPNSDLRKLGHFRLIVDNQALFPNNFDYAKELIDQINRFGLFKKQNTNEDQLTHQLAQISKAVTFDDIFATIFPNSTNGEFFIHKFLKSIEPRLTPKEATDLRLQLITHISSEIYLPLRAAVLAEKEKFERKSVEMAQRQEWMIKKNKELENSIKQAEVEHRALEEEAKLRKNQISNLENENARNVEVEKATAQKLKEIELKLKCMREEQALADFVNNLYRPNPGTLEEIYLLPSNWETQFSLLEIVKKLLVILEMNSWPQNLKEQIDKNKASDKIRIIEAINYIREKPDVRPDGAGKLNVKGNHLILANLLQEIQNKLNDSIVEIDFISRGNLIINTDLMFRGKNLVFVGKHLVVPIPVQIDVSGKDAHQHSKPKASDGVNDGNSGEDGLPGAPGVNGGDVHVEATESLVNPSNLKVNCAGGAGGDGQSGGNGAPGRPGKDGDDATPLPEPSWTKSYFDSFHFIKSGEEGKPGDFAGHGGFGGLGGDGGKGGTFICKCPKFNSTPKKFDDGKRGSDGACGARGLDGAHGRHGRDHGWAKPGYWENSVPKWGFSLKPKEIPGLLFTGYELVEGPEPPYPTLTSQNQLQSTQTNKFSKKHKHETKIRISMADVSSLRNSISGDNESICLDSSFLKEQTKLTSNLAQLKGKQNLVAKSGSTLSLKLKQEEEALKRLEKNDQIQLENILKMQNKRMQDQVEAAKVKEEEALALEKVKVLEKKAAELENEHKEIEKTTTIVQRQVLRRSHQRQNKLCHYQSVDIPDCPSLAYARAPTLDEICEDDIGFDICKFLKELGLADWEMTSLIESCLQTVNTSLGYIPENLLCFLQDKQNFNEGSKYCGLPHLTFIRTKLANDILVAEKYGDTNLFVEAELQDSGQKSLLDLILALRQRKILKFSPSPKFLKLGPDLKEIMDEILEFETFKEVFNDWVNESVQAESSWEKAKFWKGKEAHNSSQIKRQLLERARDIYLEVKKVLKKDLKDFLSQFVKHVKNPENDNPDLDKIFRDFLTTFECFQFKFICKSLESADQVQNFGFDNLSTILHKLKLHVGDLQQIQLKIKKLKISAQMGKSFKDALLAFESKLLTMYQTQIQAELLTKTRKVCQSKGGKNLEYLSWFEKFEVIVESTHLNLPFSERKKAYEEIQGKLERAMTLVEFQDNVREYSMEMFKASAHQINQHIPKYKNQTDEPKFDAVKEMLEHFLNNSQLGKEKSESIVGHFTFIFQMIQLNFDELAQVEAIIWGNLKSFNADWCSDIQKGIEASSRTLFTTALTALDFKLCQGKLQSLEKHLLDFVPLESVTSENHMTETTKTRKFLKFSLLRIELILAENGDFRPILELEEKIRRMDKTHLKPVLDELDDFYKGQLYILLPAVERNYKTSSLSDFLHEAVEEFDYLEDYNLLYLRTLSFVHFEEEDSEQPPKEKIETLKKKMGEGSRSLSETAKLTLGRLQKAIYSITDNNSDYPYQSIRERLLETAQKFNEFQNVLMRISAKAQRFTCLDNEQESTFATVRYLSTMKMKVLDNLNLNNLYEAQALIDSFDDNFMNSIKVEENSQGLESGAQNSAFVRLFKIIFPKLPFSLTELDIVLRAIFDSEFEEEELWSNYCQLLQNLRKESNDEMKQEIWSAKKDELRILAKKGSKNEPNLRNQLLEQYLCSTAASGVKQFLERVILKLLTPTTAQTLTLKRVPETQRDIFKQIFPICDPLQLEHMLLNESESKFLIFAQDNTEIAQAFQSIFSSLPPSKWLFNLEKVIFEKLLSYWLPLVSHRYSEDFKNLFKTAFFLSPNRFGWLQLIDKLFRNIQVQNPIPEEDVLNLFRFSPDLDFTKFQKLVYEKFPKNLLKGVLEEFVLDYLLKSQPKDFHGENSSRNLEAEFRQLLFQFNQEFCKYKLEFLLILHPRLIQIQKSLSGDYRDQDSNLVLKIFKNLVKNRLHSKDLNNLFKKYPLPYWPRIIRTTRLQSLNLSQDICELLLGMDEKFGEDLVDRFSQDLKTLQLAEGKVQILVRNFKSCEWIFDDGALAELRKYPTVFEEALKEYSLEKRKEELSLEEIISTAKSHRLNSENGGMLDQLSAQLLEIKKIILEEQGKVKTNKYEGKKAILKKRFSALRPKKLHWQRQFPGDRQLFINKLIAFIFMSAELYFTQKEPLKDMRPRDVQMLTLLSLVRDTEKKVSRIGEIETGEGKSLIVAMFAAFCGFCGANVNVITSNKVLAEEDSKKFKDFYELLDLKVSNNCDSTCTSNTERKKRYNSHIVYGEVGCFQADMLNTGFYMKGIDCRKVDVVIVDEVDSLLLDKGANMLYLSHEIPELRHLKTVLLLIWEAIQARDCTPDGVRQYSENDLNSVRKSVEKRLNEDKKRKDEGGKQEVLYPACLDDFVKKRVGVWVKQGFRARFMPTNEDFIVTSQKVINMDKDTGVELISMQYSLALQQFLQLRSGTKISPESLKCVFMSNLAYFNNYKGKVYGITGTVGDDDEQNLLRDKYGFEFFGMPRFKFNKMVEEDTLLCEYSAEEGNKSWLEGIKTSVMAHASHPILIISENIAKLELIKESLGQGRIAVPKHIKELKQEDGISPGNRLLLEYKSSEKDQDFTSIISKIGGLTSKHIILSTNLAGRGTDLKISEDVQENNGGLHVILTFLPQNMRVEKQAFGRTARAGESGTVQFVLQVTKQGTTIDSLKEERRVREMNRMNIITSRDLPRIELEDELFTLYKKFIKEEIRPSRHFGKFPKRLREFQISCLNNRWAIWLDSIRDHLDALYLQGGTRDKMLVKFEIFKEEMLDALNGSSYASPPFMKFPSELIKCGILYEQLGTKTLANTLLGAEFKELGQVSEELWDTIKSGYCSLEDVLMNRISGNDMLDSITDYAKRDSHLTNGIKQLIKAHNAETIFSEAASAYNATLHLQDDPTAKKLAKRNLRESIQKIDMRIEQHIFCTELITLANAHRARRNEPNIPDQLQLKNQIDSEISLLQHHLSCIRAAFHSDVTTSSINSLLTAVNSVEEAQEIFNAIMTLPNLMKNYRFSKKNVHMLEALLGPSDKFPFIRKPLGDIDMDTLRNQLQVNPTEAFTQFVFSNQDFTQLLLKHQVLEVPQVSLDDTVCPQFAICLNNQHKKQNKAQLPSNLANFEKSIVNCLETNFGQIYDDDFLEEEFEILDLDDKQKSDLKKYLLKVGWIKKSQIFHVNPKFIKEHINLEETGPTWNQNLPQDLMQHKETLLNVLYDAENCQRTQLTLTFFEAFFPCPDHGSRIIFDHLITKKVIKEPRVRFKSKDDYDGIQGQVDAIKVQLESIKPSLEEIHRKYHMKDHEGKDGESQNGKYAGYLLKFQKFVTRKLEQEKETPQVKEMRKAFEKHFKQILEYLLTSVGSLKRYPKIRVNYQSIASRVALESNQVCDELEEWKREGTFDRVFSFDERIAWYENPALRVVALGVAEIVLGVVLEWVSWGTLSPVAAYLISEGSSDLLYSTKLLWKGQRLTWDQYWQYKKESLIVNALIPSSGATMASTIFRSIRETLLREFSKASIFTLLETFVDNHIRKAFDANIAGLGEELETIMQTPDFKQELNSFVSNARALRAFSSSSQETKVYLQKIVRPLLGEHGVGTVFNLELEQIVRRIESRVIHASMKLMNKSTMPIRLYGLWGRYGDSKKGIQNSKIEIAKFSVQSMVKFNKEVEEKVAYLRGRVDSPVEVGKDAEFESYLTALCTQVKADLKKRVLDEVYAHVCSPLVLNKMKEEFTSTYGKSTYNAAFGGTGMLLDDTRKRVELEDGDGVDKDKMSDSTIVSNAKDRTIGEVKKLVEDLQEEEIEFVESNFGNCYVNLLSSESPMLGLQEDALDHYLLNH